MMSKRGVSPLIATVLLIAFAIALGVVVMSWGRNYVREVGPEPESFTYEVNCAGSDIRIPVVNNQKRICYYQGDGIMEFFADNTGSEEIIGFKVAVVGNDGIDNKEIMMTSSLVPGDIRKETFEYDAEETGDTIEKVRIMPIIQGLDEDKLCPASATDVVNIRECVV